jgi:hypothetical protein
MAWPELVCAIDYDDENTSITIEPVADASRVALTLGGTGLVILSQEDVSVGQKYELTVDAPAKAGTRYTIDVSLNGAAPVTVAYISQTGDTAADVIDALFTDGLPVPSGLNHVPGVVAAKVLSPTTLIITPAILGDRFYVRNFTRNIQLRDVSRDSGISSDLSSIAAISSEWYAVLIESTSKAEITQAAAWCEAASKMFLALSCDAGCFNPLLTTDTISALSASAYSHTGCFATRDTLGHVNACIIGRQLSRDPGSSTFFGKNATGPVPDALNATESAAIKAKHGLSYCLVNGLAMVSDGWGSSGRFLDLTHGKDWLLDSIQNAVLAVISSEEKIDFDDNGIAMIKSAVSGSLGSAESRHFVQPGWQVLAPLAGSVSTLNKASRLLPDVKFKGVLGGGIHKVIIDGTLKV